MSGQLSVHAGSPSLSGSNPSSTSPLQLLSLPSQISALPGKTVGSASLQSEYGGPGHIGGFAAQKPSWSASGHDSDCSAARQSMRGKVRLFLGSVIFLPVASSAVSIATAVIVGSACLRSAAQAAACGDAMLVP